MFNWLFGTTETREEIREPATVLGVDDPLAELYSRHTGAAGVFVTHTTALSLPATWAAVKTISETIGGLPICVYRDEPDGTRTENSDHRLHEIFNDEANTAQDALSARAAIVANYLLHGFGVALILREGPTAVGFLPFDSLRCVLRWRTSGETFVSLAQVANDPAQLLELWVDGRRQNIDDWLIVTGPTADGSIPFSPVALFNDTYSLAKAIDVFGAAFFKNSGKRGTTYSTPSTWSPQKNLKFIEALKQAHQGPDKAYRDSVLTSGVTKDDPRPTSNNESQFLESRQNLQLQQCAIHGLPPQFAGDWQRATWANTPEMIEMFQQFTLVPIVKKLEQQYRKKMLTAAERASGYFVEHNFDAILRGSPEARAQQYAQATGRPWLTVNEVRALDNREALDGGDELPKANPTPPAPSAPPAPAQAPAQVDEKQGGQNA